MYQNCTITLPIINIFFSLWRLLKCDRSELCEVCVPLLLHCISLPSGAEALVDEAESTFTNRDWKVRFDGVSKVTVIARYIQNDILSNDLARSSLALCFAYMVGAIEDVSNPVSMHVVVMLETIHASNLRVMYECLITQFDLFPSDRLLIIHTFRLLHNALPKRTPLSGHLFLRRFTQLFVEKTSLVASAHPSRAVLSRQTNLSEKSTTSSSSATGDQARNTGKGTCLVVLLVLVERKGCWCWLSYSCSYSYCCIKSNSRVTVKVTVIIIG